MCVGMLTIGARTCRHLETDSETWAPLNERLLLTKVSITLPGTGDGLSHVDIYGMIED